MLSESLRNKNHLAIALLVFGKLLGIAGLVAGAAHRVAGGTLLLLDGLFLLAAVVLCVGAMNGREKEDRENKKVLAQMVREGTLQQYLRDLKEAPPSQSLLDADTARRAA